MAGPTGEFTVVFYLSATTSIIHANYLIGVVSQSSISAGYSYKETASVFLDNGITGLPAGSYYTWVSELSGSEIKVYPNPTPGLFNIESNQSLIRLPDVSEINFGQGRFILLAAG